MLFRCFIFTILLYSFHALFLFLPYETLNPFIFVIIFSLVIYPTFSSLFNNKKSSNLKKGGFVNAVKSGFILSTILTSTSIILFFIFAFVLSYKTTLFIILASLLASIFITSLILISSFFSFVPLFKNDIPLCRIVKSFEIAKKCYHKTFAATLKIYISLFLIIPFPFVLKSYIKKINLLFKIYSGGDDGVRTHDLLNAIQTRSQLRHAPNESLEDFDDLTKTRQFIL